MNYASMKNTINSASLQYLGKNKVPRSLQAKLEQITEKVAVAPKPKRKPPSERKPIVHKAKGLRGRTK